MTEKIKNSFHKQNFIYVTCSKCNAPFSTNDEIGQEVYPTKSEAIEALKEYGWIVKGDLAICENCSEK